MLEADKCAGYDMLEANTSVESLCIHHGTESRGNLQYMAVIQISVF